MRKVLVKVDNITCRERSPRGWIPDAFCGGNVAVTSRFAWRGEARARHCPMLIAWRTTREQSHELDDAFDCALARPCTSFRARAAVCRTRATADQGLVCTADCRPRSGPRDGTCARGGAQWISGAAPRAGTRGQDGLDRGSAAGGPGALHGHEGRDRAGRRTVDPPGGRA